MGFSAKVKQEVFVKSARHCCVCHKPKGINIEVHHIIPQHQGGEDTLGNAIALCFDCHADAGHYFAGHPKGSKLSPQELMQHKEEWFSIVKLNKINTPKENFIDITITNKNYDGFMRPTFVKEETRYIDRDSYKKIYELLGKDPMDLVNKLKERNKNSDFFRIPFIDKINTYEEYIDYLNGDFPEPNYLKEEDEITNTDCQPIKYHFPNFISFGGNKEKNLSNCILNLKLTNYGPEVLENYKLYLYFENVIEVDSVNKNTSALDLNKYRYNIRFTETCKAEFIPEKDVLVQNDSVTIDSICFRAKHDTSEVIVKWELFARNINSKGTLNIIIKPEFELDEKEKFIKNSKDVQSTTRIIPKTIFE